MKNEVLERVMSPKLLGSFPVNTNRVFQYRITVSKTDMV